MLLMDPAETTTEGLSQDCRVPIRRVADSSDTAGWLSAIGDKPYPALLESSLYNPRQGSSSILAWDPYKKVTLSGKQIEINDFRANTTHFKKGDPFRILSKEFEKKRVNLSADFPLPFAGGAIGYFSYDLRHHIESLPATCSYDLPVPEFALCFYEKALVFDHKRDITFMVGGNTEEFQHIRELRNACLKRKYQQTEAHRSLGPHLKSNFSPEGYKNAVAKVIDYISAGDIFQANLSQRFEGTCCEDALKIYQRLRSINPAPFSAFLRYPSFEIVSSSPERFLLLDGDLVTTRPIKGTRPRREGDRAFNQKMKRELEISPKDHAELAMIVDLERNDLGRVCSYGSVRVKEHARLETYPTVYHLVSTVEGRIHRPQFDEFDLLRAAFPGGSVTGAPKIRAMEIIEELEPTARNIYTGSIGYVSFHGRMDMNILIRTMLLMHGKLYMQFGGGIVADSDPESEYRETIYKGNALFKAAGAPNYEKIMSMAEPGD